MANEKTKHDDTKATADRSGTHTGAPQPAKGERGDATDPLQAPLMDASPERFLAQTPAHIAALGADAPSTPYATDGGATGNPKGMKRYMMHATAGKKIAGRIRPAGEAFYLSPDEAAKHPELTEIDGAGKPVAGRRRGPDDKHTTEADGGQKRGG